MSHDVTIRGAGIFGLSTAWACAMRGARVQVIDPNGAGAGASGGLVGALAPHVPENWNDKKAFQLDSLLSAEAFWAEVEAAGGGVAGYGRTGRIQPVADAHALELARGREATARELWGDHARWEVLRADAVDGPVPLSPSGWVIHDTLSGRMHPRRACAALVAGLAAKGVTVAPEGADEGQVLWATGAAGIAEMSAALGKSVGGAVKGQAALLDFAAPQAAQLFAGGVHIIFHADGTTAIGSTSEREFDAPDTTDGQLDAVIEAARAAFPPLAEAAVLERWAGLRPRAKSRAPMLGGWPDRPGHFIANGGFKIGFGMAPGVARAMADLMLEGRDTVPEGFRVEANL